MEADYIIKSDHIFISGEGPDFDGYVVIKDGKIRSLTKDPSGWLGNKTEKIDASGKTVCPGFVDAHTHLFMGALRNLFPDLSTARSEEEAAERVRSFQNRRAENGWLFGFGWSDHKWANKTPPSKHSLDKFFPDFPVALFNDELHSLWLNSRALSVCGISRESPGVDFGTIERDADGEPTGYLLELSALEAVAKKAFDFSQAYLKSTAKEFLGLCAGYGITGLSDIQILCPDMAPVYKALEKSGDLSLRINLTYPLDMGPALVKETGAALSSDMLKIASLKAFVDGTPFCGTGFLTEPYENNPGFKGGPFLDFDSLASDIACASRLGIQVRLHACGDGAVRFALDAFEKAAQRTDIRPCRHTVEHIEIIHPNDLPRFGRLGVIPSVQPEHMNWRDLPSHPFFQILGEKRCWNAWPFKSLSLENGYCGFGTDFPVVGLNPFTGLRRAVSRQMEDGFPAEGWNPEERMSLPEALNNYTLGSAKVLHFDDVCGTLEPGKSADLVILDGDILRRSFRELEDTKVLHTFLAGRVVYSG